MPHNVTFGRVELILFVGDDHYRSSSDYLVFSKGFWASDVVESSIGSERDKER